MNGPSLVNYGHEVQLAWMPTTTNQDRVFVVTLGRLDRKMGVAEPRFLPPTDSLDYLSIKLHMYFMPESSASKRS